MRKSELKVRKAVLDDVPEIYNIIRKYSRKGFMLFRHKSEIAQHIRNYFVGVDKDKVIACCALRVWDEKSAEIYALAVKEEYMGLGFGTRLVKLCLKDAKTLKLPFVFTLTFRPSLFKRLGFDKIKINHLPRIIFTEKTVDVDKAYGLYL
jgi:amino-acid N-acetyltransferase